MTGVSIEKLLAGEIPDPTHRLEWGRDVPQYVHEALAIGETAVLYDRNGQPHSLVLMDQHGQYREGPIVGRVLPGPPPPHALEDVTWYREAPTEPGFYWLLGDPRMGSMGGHYAGTIKPDIELHFVEVLRIGDGTLSAMSGGTFVYLDRWTPESRGEGWVGKWARVTMPKIPMNPLERQKA